MSSSRLKFRRTRSTALAFALLAVLPACGPVPDSPASRPAATGAEPTTLTPSGRYALAEHAVSRAERLMERREHAAAAEKLAEAISLDPVNRQARFLLGLVRYESKQFPEAVAALRGALEIQEDALGQLWLGMALDDAGQPEAALAAFRKALEIDPESYEARHNLGYLLRSSGRPEEAVATLAPLLEKRPDQVRTLYELGLAQAEAGRSEEARATLVRLIELMPSHRLAREKLRDLGHALSDEALEAAVSERRSAARSLLQRGLEAHRRGDYAAVVELGDELIALRSGDSSLEAKANNNICSAYIQLEAWSRAILHCQRALSLDPDLERARNNLRAAQSRL